MLQTLLQLNQLVAGRSINAHSIFNFVSQTGTFDASPWSGAEEPCIHVAKSREPLERRIHPAIEWHKRRPHISAVTHVFFLPVIDIVTWCGGVGAYAIPIRHI